MGGSKLLVLQYHSKDKYATPATEGRLTDYKVKGLPTLMLNGVRIVLGGSSGSYSQQTLAIQKESAKSAPVTLTVSVSSGGEILASVTVSNVSGADLNNIKLMAVVSEDLGTELHHYVVRDVMAPVILSLAAGAKQSFDFKSTCQGANLNLVAFVQDGSGEVLQAAAAGNAPVLTSG